MKDLHRHAASKSLADTSVASQLILHSISSFSCEATLVEVQVVEADTGHTMSSGRNGDDTAGAAGFRRCFKHRRLEELEEEVRHVVCSQLRFEAVFSEAVRARHDACVDDENIETVVAGLVLFGSFANGCK